MVTEETIQPISVGEWAARLEDRLLAEGPKEVAEIREWLGGEGVEPRLINMTLGQGNKRGAKGWHRDGNVLIGGPRPTGKPEPTIHPGQFSTTHQPSRAHRDAALIPLVEEALDRSTLHGKFQGLLESLGVDESQAKIAANFCLNSFDMENPAEVWQAMRECPQIGQPVMKKQLWRLWTKTLRVDIPETLAQQVDTWNRTSVPSSVQPGRKWFVIDGQVVPTTPDDPDGMTMADALRFQSIQRGNQLKDGEPGGGLVTTLLQQQGETDRERLKLEAQRGSRPEGESVTTAVINQFGEVLKSTLNKPADTSFEGRIEAQRREFETRMEAQNQRFMDLMTAQGERHQHMLEMVQTQNTHALELVRLSMEGNNNRPSVIEQIEAVLSSGLIERLKPAPTPVSMITGPNGQMTLEVYKAIREMDLKTDALSFAKTTVPELFTVAKDMAQATRQLALTRGHTVVGDQTQPDMEEDYREVETPEPAYILTRCAHCDQPLNYPAGAKYLICPQCRAPQTADGHLIGANVPPAEPDHTSEVDELVSPEPIAPVPQEMPEPVQQVYSAAADPDPPTPEEEGVSPLLFGTYYIQPETPSPEEAQEPRREPELAAAGSE